MFQRTFVMIKPDAVNRGLIGEIIEEFERAKLLITRIEMIEPRTKVVSKHYPNAQKWLRSAGSKTIQICEEKNIEVNKIYGTNDPLEIGELVRKYFIQYICSGRIVIMVLEGQSAIKRVKKICGYTIPEQADPKSIRGRYSSHISNQRFGKEKIIRNFIHSAGNIAEAEFEINLWFK